MRPTLLSIPDVPIVGDLDFHAYAVFLAIAFLVGVLMTVRQNYKLPNPHPITPIGGIWIFVGAMIGARVYWVLQYDDPAELLSLSVIYSGGLVFFGGLIGGLVGAVAYLKLVGAPVIAVGDLGMPYLALAHGIARIGCFLNGCCWGARTDLPWAVHYPKSRYLSYKQHLANGWITPDAPHTAGVHPVQLYETLGLVVAFFIMRQIYRRPHHRGQVFLCYPLFYGAIRFCTESLRGDSARPVGTLTVSQTIALTMFLSSALLFLLLKLTIWKGEPPQNPGEFDQNLEREEAQLEHDAPAPEKG